MQSIRSGGSADAIAELKNILEIISDPDKLKSVLNELDAEIAQAVKASAELSEKKSSLLKLEQDQAAKAKELSALEESLNDRQKSLSALASEVNSAKDSLSVRENWIAKKEADFAQMADKKRAEIEAKEHAVDNTFAEAVQIKAKAEEMLKAYEDKAAKLKAAMGA